MAGYTPLLIESDGINHSVPDHFQDVVVILNDQNDPLSAKPIFYAERDTVVDAVFITAAAASGTLTLKTTASGTPSITNAHTITTSFAAATVDAENNLVPAGTAITADFSSASNNDMVVVQMRIRTRTG
jgi:hypothetical protein